VGQYVAYDELNTDHQAHFERQFNVLMGREQPSIVIDNTSTRSNKIKDTTSTRVRKVVEKKTDYGLGGTGEAGESTPGFKGASYTDITA